MKKTIAALALIFTLAALCSCNNSTIGVIGGADGPTSVLVSTQIDDKNMSYSDIAVALAQNSAAAAADKDLVEAIARSGEIRDIFTAIAQNDYSSPVDIKLLTPDKQKTIEGLKEDEFTALYKSGEFPLTSFAASHNASYGKNTLAATTALTSVAEFEKRADFEGEFALILTYDGDYSVFVAFDEIDKAIQARATFIRNGERTLTDFLDTVGLVYTIE
ncbi:MAG: hypothetical protein E7588_06595 [Ruminococcaceae bacterium]|nr:hypothetical protein [Oscillospiraceae bacterium]